MANGLRLKPSSHFGPLTIQSWTSKWLKPDRYASINRVKMRHPRFRFESGRLSKSECIDILGCFLTQPAARHEPPAKRK